MPEKFAVYPSLRDRVVFITGGATGIGSAEVEHFAAQGARVAFVDIQEEPARALAARLKDAGHPEPWFQPCDITDVAALQSAIADAARALGPIAVLVNNAAHDERHRLAGRDGRLLGRAAGGEPAAPVLRHPGGRADDAGRRRRLDRQFRLDQLACRPGRDARLHHCQGRGRGPDARHGARPRPRRHPGQLRHPRLDHDRAAAHALAHARGGGGSDEGAVAEIQGDAGRRGAMVLWLAADDSRMCTSQLWVVDGGWM